MPRRKYRATRKGEKKVGSLRIPRRPTNKDFYEAQKERINEAVEAAQEKPGSLLLPKLRFERQLQQRTQDKLRRQRAFLEQVREGATMSDALRSVGVTRRAFRTWIEGDQYFAHLYGYSKEERTDLVEAAARDLALKGQKYLVASGGHAVGENVVRSEKMIELLLRSERPEVFGSKSKVEITGSVEFSKPEITLVIAQVKSVLRDPTIDIPALPAETVIEGVVVDAAVDEGVEGAVVADQSPSTNEEEG